MPGHVSFVAEPNQYRGIFGENAGAAPYLDEIERVIAASTTGQIAGMLVETFRVMAALSKCRRAMSVRRAVRAAGGLYR